MATGVEELLEMLLKPGSGFFDLVIGLADRLLGAAQGVLPSSAKYTYVSSSVVKEMARYGADLSDFLPREIIADVNEKVNGEQSAVDLLRVHHHADNQPVKAHRSPLDDIQMPQGDGVKTSRREKFGLVFLDPPYESGLLEKTLETIAAIDIMAGNASSAGRTPPAGYLSSPPPRWAAWTPPGESAPPAPPAETADVNEKVNGRREH